MTKQKNTNTPRVLYRPASGWARTRHEQNLEAFAGILFLAGVAIFISDVFSAVNVILEWAGNRG